MMVTTADNTAFDRDAFYRACLSIRPGRSRLSNGDYDATKSVGRRRPPRSDTRAEDRILDSFRRTRLVGTARDVLRNYVTAGWMIRCHLDYVSRFAFQARTPDAELNKTLEALVWLDGLRRNFEASGRLSRAKAMRVLEARKVLDGDVFVVKLSGGGVQLIEGDRVRSEQIGIPPQSGYTQGDFTHGVATSPGGRLRAVCVARRLAGGGYQFERILPAANVWQLACWETTYRLDQVRGISPLAPALNTLQDVYEGIDLAMAKAKVAQMFGLVFYRQAVEKQEGWAAGASTLYTDADEAPQTDEDRDGLDDDTGEPVADGNRYEVDPGAGPFKIELDENDRAEFLSTQTPETQLINAMMFCTDLSLKSLDIPYSFYDASKANYYNRKADIQQYEASANGKRADNAEFLDEHTAWRFRQRILDGTLILPDGMTLDRLEWEWVPTGMPWVDKLRDMKADQLALQSNLDSEVRIARRSGQDAHEIAIERLDYLVWLNGQRQQRNLPPLADLPGGSVPGATNTSDDPTVKGDDNA